MSALTPASEVILRQQDKFIARQVIISGDIRDLLPARIDAGRVRVQTFWYHHKKTLARALGDQLVSFDVITSATMVKGYDTLIYFWPKNKPEALFQLTNLLSLLPLGCDVFIVGENRNGVRSVECMLEAWCTLRKIDSARHCGLYHGQLNHHPHFNVDDYWQTYKVNKVVIKTLPGVFSRNRLDKGSQLLLSTFDRPLIGYVADIGCGSGVLSVVLASRCQEKVKLILSDAYAPALAASRATLEANGLRGEVLAGDVYSAFAGRFNMIISNPPFHEGIQINLQTAQTLIRGARDHLHVGGELRIVANAFLSYSTLLNEVFGSHQVLAQDGHFKVYQAFNHKKI